MNCGLKLKTVFISDSLGAICCELFAVIFILAKLDKMRQKENLETFLESLLLNEEQYKSDPPSSHTHTSLPPLSHLQRFPVSPLPLDSSPHLVSQEIVEIKTLLVKVKSLLEKESSEDLTKIRENDSERQNLETQIKQLKEELRLKNNKISELEKLINTKKETISTQTRRSQPAAATKVLSKRVSAAKSLHNISISHVTPSNLGRHSPGAGVTGGLLKPCQHSWGPCANDHSYHHARSHTRPASPWSPSSSTSSSASGAGSFHETVRYRRMEVGKYKKRALSADLLNNNGCNEVGTNKNNNDHKISIYVTHKPEKI